MQWGGVGIPWFVPWTATESERPTEPPDGRPRFELPARRERFDRALRERRCWICGDYLGAVVTFVTQPHWVVQGFAGEPPCHRDCAQFAAQHCPYFVDAPDRPLVVLWQCRKYGRRIRDAAIVIEISGATHVDWVLAGRPATRGEVVRAFDAVMPKLRGMHAGDLAGKSELERTYQHILNSHVPRI
jgi:hypothetical protein